ncbi:MAG: hypothetical protein RR012_08550, partial [Oscillospiraceae bacterium]
MAIQFTESEWLLMSSLSYAIPKAPFDNNGYPINQPPMSVIDLLDDMEKLATDGGMNKEQFVNSTDKGNYLKAIDSLKKKLGEGEFIVTKCINHN